MRTPLDVAKQAAEEIMDYVVHFDRMGEFGRANHVERIAKKIDTTTAKLREELAAANKALKKVSEYAGRLEQQLAHQQPSAPTPPTPDVEKIAREAYEAWQFYGSKPELIANYMAAAAAQARAPLVAAVREARAIICNSDRPLHVKITKAIDAALTGTGERQNDL